MAVIGAATGASSSQRPHLVMLPYPLQGHISPLMQLARRLAAANSCFLITFLTTEFNILQMRKSNPDLNLPENIHLAGIPDGLPSDHDRNPFTPDFPVAISERDFPANTAKFVESLVAGSGPPVTCLLHDSFLVWASRMASELSIPRVVFWPNSITAFACSFSADKIMAAVPGLDPFKNHIFCDPQGAGSVALDGVVPGIPSIRARDLPFMTFDERGEIWMRSHVTHQMSTLAEAELVICNSTPELECMVTSSAGEISCEELNASLPVRFIPVGPLCAAEVGAGAVPVISLWEEDEECVKWLDTQEEASVVYISLGSVSLVEEAELRQIGKGAAASGQAFLWVVKTWASVKAAEELIPEEVKDKVKEGRAKVVKWAPQLKVLGHKAVGAFVSHCGWNSTVESLSMGVPMLCLPLMMDQLTNCWMTCDQLKRGIRIDRHLGKEDFALSLETGIRRLFAGKQIRRQSPPSVSSFYGAGGFDSFTDYLQQITSLPFFH